jgi:Domain of unknown function (DUF4373)
MAKDAYWFKHDSNASQDPKILQMCSVYKSEGYGWYWMLIEQMRDQENYKLNISGKYALDAFASRFYADALRLHNFIDDCCDEFHLFKRDKSYIWSESLIRRMVKNDVKSEAAKRAAEIRWGKQNQNNANALQPHNESNANASKNDAIREEKNRIEKIRKEKSKVDAANTLKEIFYSFQNDNGYKAINFENEFKKFCEYWLDGQRKLKNKKLACHNWLDKAVEYKERGEQHGLGQNAFFKPQPASDQPAYIDGDRPADQGKT